MNLKQKIFYIATPVLFILLLANYLIGNNQSILTQSILIGFSFIILIGFVSMIFNKYIANLQELSRVELSPQKSLVDTALKLNHNMSIETDMSKDYDSSGDDSEQLLKFSIPLAHYDQITALPDYNFFLQILNKTILQGKRHKKIFALLLVEIDEFEKINFNLGQTVSDQILKQIGNRIANTLRAEDTVTRYKEGSNQFIIILNEIGKSKFASTAAVKLLDAIGQPVNTESNRPLTLTASIGVAIFPYDGDELTTLIKNLETALQKVKQMGGNGYEFYSEKLAIEAREFINIANGLRQSLAKNELVLLYQPKLHIKQGSVIGVEALMRWRHPQQGLLSPDKFIPIAEETGLISELSEWAIREACLINKHWQDEGYAHITVGLNLSPKQFFQSDIDKRIAQILHETQLNPKYLELEINESAAMDNINLAIEQMNKIKSTGIQLSLDHFGVGFTAISYLKLLPINAIKIDRLFIQGIPNQPNDCAITNALIALSHQLGFETVAEGVETAEQLSYLTEHECDMIQGYYLGCPEPEDKIVAQLAKLPEKVLI